MFYKHITIPSLRLCIVYAHSYRYIVIRANQIVVTLENDDRGARGLYILYIIRTETVFRPILYNFSRSNDNYYITCVYDICVHIYTHSYIYIWMLLEAVGSRKTRKMKYLPIYIPFHRHRRAQPLGRATLVIIIIIIIIYTHVGAMMVVANDIVGVAVHKVYI